jgi:hypothetical protein
MSTVDIIDIMISWYDELSLISAILCHHIMVVEKQLDDMQKNDVGRYVEIKAQESWKLKIKATVGQYVEIKSQEGEIMNIKAQKRWHDESQRTSQ